MTKRETAEKYFLEGCNCAQAVLCTFSNETGIDVEKCKRLASSFGGGMGRMRLTCGAFSAALMVAGILFGYDDTENDEAKAAHYRLVQELASEFKSAHVSLSCNDLLGGNADTSFIPTPRTEEFYGSRPCKKIIGDCAEMIEKRLMP